MFSEPAKILSSDLNNSTDSSPVESELRPSSKPPFKKILIILASILGIIILASLGFLVVKKQRNSSTFAPAKNFKVSTKIIKSVSSTPAILPNLDVLATTSDKTATSSFSNLKIEYLSFANFYKTPDYKIKPKINNYSFPLNVKVQVMNYYDISRKLNLDPGLNNLNNYGFTIIDNPWSKSAPDFYSIYHELNTKQIPPLITSDFIVYNYQNILKKSFKDIEENVFYNNLWDINKQLYTTARNRYEARLAKIGEVNDPILEGERLETAFFAVALELLKPQVKQISSSQTSLNSKLFTKAEAEQFYFVVPPYLRDDVLAEEKLIRQARAVQTKSPVLLYSRNYQEFTVPVDYHANAKLNNFYLTTKWLNSVFPLNYRSPDCPNCLLDKSDWRINLTAASLISQDFSLSPELTNKWARIYKVMSFFKGLREDLSYVNYRDSLSSLFGIHYKIEKIFADQNKQAMNNLEKLQAKLLAYNFPEISGGLNHNSLTGKSQIGFRMLAESYRSNPYIFNQLITPSVGAYLGTSTKKDNITACQDKRQPIKVRCNGMALDLVNLVQPISGDPYFAENTNYLNYTQGVNKIRTEMKKAKLNQLNNYWTNLNLIKAFLSPEEANLPVFARSSEWRERELKTAAAIWINLQLPLDNLAIVPRFIGTNINGLARLNKKSYIEPNLKLINELIANDNMLLGMFSALQLDREVPSASQRIKSFSTKLIALRKIENKELSGQSLTTTDNETIVDFTKQFKVINYSASNQQLQLNFPYSSRKLKEDLGHLQLLVLIHQEGNNKIFSVGPTWDYQESH